jgi:hypothetical protein
MVKLYRDDFDDGKVLTFADNEPCTDAHWINEPSDPDEDIRELLQIAEPLAYIG